MDEITRIQRYFARKAQLKERFAPTVNADGKPCAGKLCAVSRTERIATRGGRSSGYRTPRRTTNLDPKGRGDKSMSRLLAVGVKRGIAEDVYAMALQRLSDMAKAGIA